jgi:hypothetical protein
MKLLFFLLSFFALTVAVELPFELTKITFSKPVSDQHVEISVVTNALLSNPIVQAFKNGIKR